MDELTVIVIPAFNESKTIREVVASCLNYGVTIVVDDGSTDNTTEEAKKAGAIVLKQPINMGVGFATITGNQYAVKKMNGDIIINIDADGQHSPDSIPEMIQKIHEGYDFVFGSRMYDNKDMPAIKKFGNSLITTFNNYIFGVNLSDTQTGLRAFKRGCFDRLNLKSDGYSICSEFACEVGRLDLRYCEISIKAIYDEWTINKGTNLFHGIQIIYDSIIIWVFR